MLGLQLERKDVGLFVLMGIVTFVLYYPSLYYGYISLDDHWYIVNNPYVKDLSLRGVYNLFFVDRTDLHYHPVAFLSYMLDYQLFGLNSVGYKAHNLLLHIACGGMIYLFLIKLTRNSFVSFFVAFIFLIHPVNMESVVWVACRRQSLFFFYFLLSCYFYLISCLRTSKRSVYFFIAVVFGIISTLAKTSGIVFPFIFVLIYFLTKQKLSRELFFQFLLTIPIMVFFVIVNQAADERNYLKRDFDYSLIEHFIMAGYSYSFYWFKALIAYPLAVFYPAPSEHLAFLPSKYYLFFLCSVIILYVMWYHFRRKQYLHFFAITYFSICIGPTLNLMFYPLGDLPMLVANRYFYHSSLGILLYFMLHIDRFLKDKYSYKYSLMYLITICFFILFRIQIPAWENSISLFENTVYHYPSEEFYYRLAIEYAEEGDMESAFNNIDQGDQLNTDIWINNAWDYYYQRGEIYFEKGDYERALKDIKTALSKNPDKAVMKNFMVKLKSKNVINPDSAYYELIAIEIE